MCTWNQIVLSIYLNKLWYIFIDLHYFFQKVWNQYQLIDLDGSNYEFRIFVVDFCRQAQWKNQNKYSKCPKHELRVSKFRKQIELFSFEPKEYRTICFRNLLTFTKDNNLQTTRGTSRTKIITISIKCRNRIR